MRQKRDILPEEKRRPRFDISQVPHELPSWAVDDVIWWIEHGRYYGRRQTLVKYRMNAGGAFGYMRVVRLMRSPTYPVNPKTGRPFTEKTQMEHDLVMKKFLAAKTGLRILYGRPTPSKVLSLDVWRVAREWGDD